jgi:hypothetical protein
VWTAKVQWVFGGGAAISVSSEVAPVVVKLWSCISCGEMVEDGDMSISLDNGVKEVVEWSGVNTREVVIGGSMEGAGAIEVLYTSECKRQALQKRYRLVG